MRSCGAGGDRHTAASRLRLEDDLTNNDNKEKDKTMTMTNEEKAVAYFAAILGPTCKLEGITGIGGWKAQYTASGRFRTCETARRFLKRHGITYLGKKRAGHKGYAVRKYDSSEVAKAFVQEMADRGELDYMDFTTP